MTYGKSQRRVLDALSDYMLALDLFEKRKFTEDHDWHPTARLLVLRKEHARHELAYNTVE